MREEQSRQGDSEPLIASPVKTLEAPIKSNPRSDPEMARLSKIAKGKDVVVVKGGSSGPSCPHSDSLKARQKCASMSAPKEMVRSNFTFKVMGFSCQLQPEEDMRRVLEGGPWTMDNRSFVLQKWSPLVRMEQNVSL
ncbi:hypothetical protein QJS10_CPA09g00529 [Acorus calamus]|uniref:DUF4283 domain-containing protein n=1 Tax=Acorus calamus TaxID=4465 RepID=A0AAV9E4E2_ACOCL|nr:hypothetical protein QJS10_CPA09g00529 [Acorus calamus]